MEPYIMKNTELRTKATDTSEKKFFKLMNNASFGKTVENPHMMMVRPSAVEDDHDLFRWIAAVCGSGGGW